MSDSGALVRAESPAGNGQRAKSHEEQDNNNLLLFLHFHRFPREADASWDVSELSKKGF
jgi:hypothetical protein